MDDAQRLAFGTAVVRWRSERGMNQDDLARAAGIAENTLGKIENGMRTQRAKVAAVMQHTGLGVPDELPADVAMAMDMLGSWMATLSREDRRRAIRDLGTWIGQQSAMIHAGPAAPAGVSRNTWDRVDREDQQLIATRDGADASGLTVESN